MFLFIHILYYICKRFNEIIVGKSKKAPFVHHTALGFAVVGSICHRDKELIPLSAKLYELMLATITLVLNLPYLKFQIAYSLCIMMTKCQVLLWKTKNLFALLTIM